MIVHLLNPASYGGIETVVEALVRELVKRSEPCVVALVVDADAVNSSFAEKYANAGASVEVIPVQHRQYREEYRAIARMLTKVGATVVHSHGYRMDVMSRFASKTANVPWVTTLHGFTGGDVRNRVYERLQRFAVKSAARVIAVSRPIGEIAAASGVNRARLSIVRNAIPAFSPEPRASAQQQLALDPSARWVGWVGRMSAEKDPLLFADAIRAMSRKDVRGIMIGDGPEMTQLRESAAELLTEGRLVLAGPQANAKRFFSAFDALVISSVTEGTPMVVLEAMQAGIPVIGTAVGGMPDLLSDGAGVVVSQRTPEALAAGVLRVLNDEPLRHQQISAARARMASQYNVENWINEHLDIYHSVSHPHGR